MHDFRRLDVWQKSLQLGVVVYRVTRSFPRDERYGMTSQIRRGAVSVMSNIAEGSGRSTVKDVTRFLDMARGSASEVEAQALLSEQLGFMTRDQVEEVAVLADEIRAMLVGLSRSLH